MDVLRSSNCHLWEYGNLWKKPQKGEWLLEGFSRFRWEQNKSALVKLINSSSLTWNDTKNPLWKHIRLSFLVKIQINKHGTNLPKTKLNTQRILINFKIEKETQMQLQTINYERILRTFQILIQSSYNNNHLKFCCFNNQFLEHKSGISQNQLMIQNEEFSSHCLLHEKKFTIIKMTLNSKREIQKKGNLILKSQHSSLLEMSHETRREFISDMITLNIASEVLSLDIKAVNSRFKVLIFLYWSAWDK